MVTDDERNAITEYLQAQGHPSEYIERIITLIEESRAIAKRNDDQNSWVSSDELRRRLIARYGDKFQ